MGRPNRTGATDVYKRQGFLFALVVLLLLPNILPATSGIARFFKTIGNTGICMLLVTVMCLLKVDGKPLLRFKTMVDSGVTWGIILILAVVMPLSHAMANDESGITKFLMALMTPFFGNESSLVFALCMGFFATVLTQFMNNGATGIALMPVVYSYCTGMNVPPELAIIMVAVSYTHLDVYKRQGCFQARTRARGPFPLHGGLPSRGRHSRQPLPDPAGAPWRLSLIHI